MAYEPTVWKSGDVVTSAKLNNIEQGIANAILKVNMTIDEQAGVATLDKTWQEILDANYAVIVASHDPDEGFDYIAVTSLYTMPKVGGGTDYAVVGISFSSEGSAIAVIFKTDSADGYPSAPLG